MDELLKKYNALSPQGQQEVNDFLDFTLSRHPKKRMFDTKTWKEKVKDVSVWTEADIQVLEKNSKLFRQWKPEEW